MKVNEFVLLKSLLILSSLTLAVGLFAPCMTIHPGFGGYSVVVKILKPKLAQPRSYSIISGIYSMLTGGSIGIGVVIFLFSVVFPIWKISLFYNHLVEKEEGCDSSYLTNTLHKIGKFSMLDVFVMVLLVVASKSLPGGTQVKLNWGIASFAFSVILSLYVSVRIEKL